MRINTFFYSIRQGLKNIFRNKMFSLASVATMAACIFMFGLFYIIKPAALISAGRIFRRLRAKNTTFGELQ